MIKRPFLNVVAFFSLLVWGWMMPIGCASRFVPADNKETANLYFNLGNAYSELEKFEDAVKAYSRAYEIDPSFASAGYNLMRVYIYQKKFDEAEGILKDLEKEDPRNTVLLEAGGYLYHLKGETEKALRYYNRVLTADEVNANALYNSFLIYKDQKDFKMAISLLTKYLEVKTDDSASIVELATLLKESGESKKAIDQYRLYLQKEKESDETKEKMTEVRLILSELYLKEKNFLEAIEFIDALLKTDEKNPDYLFNKAWATLIGLEDYEKGVEFLNQAFDAGFSDKKRATEMASVEATLFHDEILQLIKDKGLYDPELLKAPLETPASEETSAETEAKAKTESSSEANAN